MKRACRWLFTTFAVAALTACGAAHQRLADRSLVELPADGGAGAADEPAGGLGISAVHLHAQAVMVPCGQGDAPSDRKTGGGASTLSRDDYVERAATGVRKRAGAFRDCAEQRSDDLREEGRMWPLSIEIAPTGRVFAVGVLGVDADDPFAECLRGVICGWSFPPPPGGEPLRVGASIDVD